MKAKKKEEEIHRHREEKREIKRLNSEKCNEKKKKNRYNRLISVFLNLRTRFIRLN
jgi:hypothetical protein